MYSTQQRKRIVKNVSIEQDTLREKADASMRWKNVKKPLFPYNHSRPLSRKTAQKALAYIEQLVKGYPFQIRYAMALPLWERFAQTWCDTGDESEALRGI